MYIQTVLIWYQVENVLLLRLREVGMSIAIV